MVGKKPNKLLTPLRRHSLITIVTGVGALHGGEASLGAGFGHKLMGWKAQGEALGLEHLALQPAGCSSLEAGGRGPSQYAPLWAAGPGEPSSGEGATPTALIALIPRKGSSGVLLLTVGGPKVLPTCACPGRLCKAREQNKLTVPQGRSWPAALWGGSGGGRGYELGQEGGTPGQVP